MKRVFHFIQNRVPYYPESRSILWNRTLHNTCRTESARKNVRALSWEKTDLLPSVLANAGEKQSRLASALLCRLFVAWLAEHVGV